MEEDDRPKDADDVLSHSESVGDTDEDETMRPAGEVARVGEAEESKKRLDEDVEGDEPESEPEADTGAQS